MIWTKGARQSAKFQTLDCSHKISPNFYFDRLRIVYRILVKMYRGLCLMTLNIHAKFEEKLCCFKNEKNLVKFDLSTRNSPKFALTFVLIVRSS